LRPQNVTPKGPDRSQMATFAASPLARRLLHEPTKTMAFWEELKRAREAAGLSLGELAERTKIRPHILGAIERGDWTSVGARFYARAFLRTYAAQVGLPPDRIVEQYDAIFAPPPPPQAAPPPSTVSFLTALNWSRLAPVGMIAVAGLLLSVAFSASRTNRGVAIPPEAEPGPLGTSGAGEAAIAQSPTDGQPERVIPLRLEVTPTRTLWVDGTADGARVVYKLLEPHENVVLAAEHEIRVRIGDAAALEYSINGERGRSLGESGEARTIRLTPDNYREFVVTAPE